MIRRSKNAPKMTGRKHDMFPSSKGGRSLCPWGDLAVGDWFEPGADSYIMALKRTKLNANDLKLKKLQHGESIKLAPAQEYVGVQAGGANCVVRVK
jgi:hypothetical protein